MKRGFASLAVAIPLCISSLAHGTTIAVPDEKTIKYHALLRMVEDSHIVATGKIVHINDLTGRGHVTDFIFRIDTLIKGKPNLYDDYIKFSLEGGLAFHNGELSRMEIAGYPEYYLGDELMLFLGKKSGSVPPDYQKTLAHDELYIVNMWHGKKDIESGTVRFGYLNPEKRMYCIKFPIELAINLAKAYVRNKEATLALEDEIKTIVSRGIKQILPNIAAWLTDEAEQIISTADEDKRKSDKPK